jgi:alanyl-tRNA synthetase
MSKFKFLEELGFSAYSCITCNMKFWQTFKSNQCGECNVLNKLLYKENYVACVQTIEEVEANFLNYFVNLGYQKVPPRTLKLSRHNMHYVMAGICCYYPLFTNGYTNLTNTKFVNAQTCIRFNDYEQVGVSNRHYTNFIMLGQHIFETDNYKFTSNWERNAFLELYNFVSSYFKDDKLITIHESTWSDQIAQGDSLEIFINGIECFNQVYTTRNYLTKQILKYRFLDMGAGLERFFAIVNKIEIYSNSDVILKDHMSTVIKMYSSGIFLAKKGVGHTMKKLLIRLAKLYEYRVIEQFLLQINTETWIIQSIRQEIKIIYSTIQKSKQNLK